MERENTAGWRFKMVIRTYNVSDGKCLAELFYNTVHAVNAKDYTVEQLNAWAPGNVDLEQWNQSFLAHHSVVAVEENEIVGFGDMDQTGYLDRLFVHKDYQRRGIATAICDALERAAHTDKITTKASITARPFFEKRGYRVIRRQTAVRAGVLLVNYDMEK